jgi:alkaline phosphatase D
MKSIQFHSWSRRQFLLGSALTAGGVVTAGLLPKIGATQSKAPALITAEKMRPQIPYGVAIGDMTDDRAIIWSRSDRPARLIVEYSTDNTLRKVQLTTTRPAALETSDYTARVEVTDLPSGAEIFYRVRFQDLADINIYSEPFIGSFRTPAINGDLFFAWAGDTAGQGWGVNPDWGGMKIYETIRQLNPHFFIHSGDYIYADHPIQSEVQLKDGKIWKNLTTPEKSKVAETLAEFRGNYVYNLLDENVRRFNAQVPQLVQWDDHETTNNWYPGRLLTEDDRYTVKSCDLLAARAKRAFLEYVPMRWNATDPERIYRAFSYGNNLEIFMLDMRSDRGANSANRQPVPSAATAFLGSQQIQWLKAKLKTSRALWKVIASDMPLGLVVPDGKTGHFENLANGDGQPLGRELELAELLRFIKDSNIQNVVWLTADVHYAAAHYYNPTKAQFSDFKPFWEFVAGPMNSGTYGPNSLDNTFGPEVKFSSLPPGNEVSNLPPSDKMQFFGTVKIDGDSKVMTVGLHNLFGKLLYSVNLSPEG